jgi:hypothetical protein
VSLGTKGVADPAQPEEFIKNLCQVYRGAAMWVSPAVETRDTVLSQDDSAGPRLAFNPALHPLQKPQIRGSR